MRYYIRSFIGTLCSLLSMASYAVDHIRCTLSHSGIPDQVQMGQAYANTYTCINTYPETDAFPPIQLVGTVFGKSTGTSVSGSCMTQKLASDDSCQFVLKAHFQKTGQARFYLQVSVGSLYYLNLPSVRTKIIPGPIHPTLIWPGSNVGSAQVDSSGNGSGFYVANAYDTSGEPILYTFALSGAGTVTANQNGSFSLSGIDINSPGTLTVTANSLNNDAPPAEGTPIQISSNSSVIPNKIIAFYNDSNETIYPIIEAPILTVDAWLQAQFSITDISTYKFTSTKIYRAYVNGTNGISPGQTVLVQVPFYSELVNNPTGGNQPDQYLDWWNAMRVYLYDVQSNLIQQYNQDSAHPVHPVTPGPSCFSGCSGQLEVFSSTTGVPTNDPQQLTEYTFADVVTGGGTPYPIDYTHVDYDYSGVDQIYLSVAMEPYGSSIVGYTGTTVDLTTFRANISTFLTDTVWPVYAGLPVTKPRVPGAYNVMVLNPQLTTPQPQIDALTTNWHKCINDAGNTNHANCLIVNNLFQTNASACGQSPTELELLQHIYGYVSFCGDLPSSGSAFDAYTALQHNFIGYPQDFNPYTQLIHQTLKMNVYAYSVDDAVGNINTIGDGIVIDIGGESGLSNPEQYDPQKITTVNPGTPLSGPYFTKFGVCSATATQLLAKGGSFSFQLPNSSYPCIITLEDSNNVVYSFSLNHSAPLTTTAADITCGSPGAWCSGVLVADPKNVNTPIPNP